MNTENIVREIVISENIGEGTAATIIREIRNINAHDDKQEEEKKEYKREPIIIVVNSYGGSVYDGLAIIAAMQTSKTPVHTICYGKAMSMGFFIMLAGHKRFGHPLATFMYHQIRGWMGGELEEVKRSVKEWERLERMVDELTLKRTTILEEKLDTVKDRKQDWFISAEEAKKLGIIDEILGEAA